MSKFYIPLQDHALPIENLENSNWGIEKLFINTIWGQFKGKGIKVAIIDTGISEHPDLPRCRIKNKKNFTDASNKYNVTDEHPDGHGTHIAGIIAAQHNNIELRGIAPEVDLYIAKVASKENDRLKINAHHVTAAIKWAICNHVHIINISLASPYNYVSVRNAINEAIENEIIVVCGAGNKNYEPLKKYVQFPANMKNTIAVGAVSHELNSSDISTFYVCGFSPFARDNELDIMAPGESIPSAFTDGEARTLDGTSVATPFVVGTLALYLEKHFKYSDERPSIEQVKEHLKSSAKQFDEEHNSMRMGAGLLQPIELINKLIFLT